jgi:hypothetical protein
MGGFNSFLIDFLRIKNTHQVKHLNGELNHYGEIININGQNKTFFLDEIHPIYLQKKNFHQNWKYIASITEVQKLHIFRLSFLSCCY